VRGYGNRKNAANKGLKREVLADWKGLRGIPGMLVNKFALENRGTG